MGTLPPSGSPAKTGLSEPRIQTPESPTALDTEKALDPSGHGPNAVRMELLSPRQVDAMRRAGAVAATTLDRVGQSLRPGMRARDIDRLVREDTAAHGATPAQLGYHGFPAAVCVSIDDVACHGIPGDQVLREGSLVSVDVTSELGGWHGDTCRTFAVGALAPEAAHLMATARRCMEAGIAEVRHGARLGDVGAAIEALARSEGCDVVRAVGGHGIGRKMHQPPHVDHFGRPGRGRRLREGMAITVEPILVLGSPELSEDDDGWTLRTADGSLAAQFEHTLLVTRGGAEILTPAPRRPPPGAIRPGRT
jgi:methionyl aminopeptidase